MKKEKQKINFSRVFLVVYAFFLIMTNYALFSSVYYAESIISYVPIGNWDCFVPFTHFFNRLTRYDLFESFLYSLSLVKLHNLFYLSLHGLFNVLFPSGLSNMLLAMNLSHTIVYVLLVTLIYAIRRRDGHVFYALFAAMLFSSFPLTVIYSKTNSYHLNESLYILLSVYLYQESNFLKKKWHFPLLSFFIICSLFSGLDIRSGVMYMSILLTVHLVFSLKKQCEPWYKNYFILIGLFCALIVSCFKLNELISYVGRKLSWWLLFSTDGWLFFLHHVFIEFPARLIDRYIYLPILLLILTVFLLNIFLRKSFVKTRLEVICEYMIAIPLFISFITCDKTAMDDIFPVLPFLALKVSYCFERIFQERQYLWGKAGIFGALCVYAIFVNSYWGAQDSISEKSSLGVLHHPLVLTDKIQQIDTGFYQVHSDVFRFAEQQNALESSYIAVLSICVQKRNRGLIEAAMDNYFEFFLSLTPASYRKRMVEGRDDSLLSINKTLMTLKVNNLPKKISGVVLITDGNSSFVTRVARLLGPEWKICQEAVLLKGIEKHPFVCFMSPSCENLFS